MLASKSLMLTQKRLHGRTSVEKERDSALVDAFIDRIDLGRLAIDNDLHGPPERRDFVVEKTLREIAQLEISPISQRYLSLMMDLVSSTSYLILLLPPTKMTVKIIQ